MELGLVDTQYVDVALVGGSLLVKIDGGLYAKGQLELPLVAILKKLAADSTNKIDDAIVELIEKALAPA